MRVCACMPYRRPLVRQSTVHTQPSHFHSCIIRPSFVRTWPRGMCSRVLSHARVNVMVPFFPVLVVMRLCVGWMYERMTDDMPLVDGA